jgi:hypothetical protein
MNKAKDEPRDHRKRHERYVRPRIRRQSDDDHCPAWTDKFGEPRERPPRVHVVKGRHRNHSVEGFRLERNLEYVTVHPLDCFALMSRTRSVENRSIDVKAKDVGHTHGIKFRRKNTVTTSHIKYARDAV